MRLLASLALGAAALQAALCAALDPTAGGHGRPVFSIRGPTDARRRDLLQNIVGWDANSLFVHGERVMVFSGEFHPFRLPVPSLYLDVFQKVKALGLNTVSFYVDWALLEGKPGKFSAEGVFAFEPFFQAAKDAGVFLIARPGPYINAEVSGGGFPGWLQRVRGHLRTNDSDYLAATDNYMANIGRIIADGQITRGGPIILVQPENEYSGAQGVAFPVGSYMAYVEDQLRQAGVDVPFISNDAFAGGHNAPGTGVGEVDIYGHDAYPLGFDCAKPTVWPTGTLPSSFRQNHERQSPKTPYALVEFQGGAFDPPGGLGFDQCAALLNHEFERVFYKNNLASGVAIFNIYMIFGGTNWGNLGHPGGYTSYDYGSAIKENRAVTREKYSELKLEAQFLRVSPGYLVAKAGANSTRLYSQNAAVTITPLLGVNGSFFVVRHTAFATTTPTKYTLSLPTSAGNLTVPQLGGALTLAGRDSKVHVVDYPVGDFTLLYSTAEIFTWQTFSNETVLVVYGGPGELHELALKGGLSGEVVQGSGATLMTVDNVTVVQWETTPERKVVQFDGFTLYMLDRNSAYNYWVPEYKSPSIIVRGGYLIRSASISTKTLSIKADFNTTTTLEIFGVPPGVDRLQINGAETAHTVNSLGLWEARIPYPQLKLAVPDLHDLDWMSVDSLPELSATYDDSAWVAADHPTTNNTLAPLQTPTSVYASDYGFHTGVLLFRGHFTAAGPETRLTLTATGGQAFAFSVFLGATLLASWPGTDRSDNHTLTLPLPRLAPAQPYTLTVVLDNTGLDENWTVGPDQMKRPRGILRCSLAGPAGGPETPVAWKVAGNFGGEDFADGARGPLNEGGLFAERMGYHLPAPPAATFSRDAWSSPFVGLDRPGVAFYAAKLELRYPSPKFDIPLAFAFVNDTAGGPGGAYRAFLYVNGWQFGRYTSNIGPQTNFPVPEGILNYNGTNWIGLALWALEKGGAKVADFYLSVGSPVLTGREAVSLVESPAWTARKGAY